MLLCSLSAAAKNKDVKGPDNSTPNTLTKADKKAGWELLWDGKTSAGWRSVRSEEFPESGWGMKDGVLTVNPEGSKRGGDIITVEKYADFWFSFDFKLTPGANSGVKYFVNPGNFRDPSIGCEFQVLDNDLHPDAKAGINGNRTVASLYDLIRADVPEGVWKKYDWNTAWLIVKGNHVEHWLNGVKVVEYERNNQMFNALVQTSKYAHYEGFGNFPEGHLLLQDHMDTVHFRNLKIKKL